MTRPIPLALAFLLAGLFSPPARAACSWTTLTNGTPANATQVMDNFDCLATRAGPVFSGLVGIGTTPAYVLDVEQNIAGDANIRIYNPSTSGVAASKLIAENNGLKTVQLAMLGGSFSTFGVFRQDGAVLYSNGAGGITLDTGVAQPIYFAINNSEVARIDTSGNLLLGYSSSAGSYRLQVNSQIYATSATIATSDRRLKHYEGPASAALLDAAFNVPVRLYTRKDHPEFGVRAGYWAQDWLNLLTINGVKAGGKSSTPAAGMVPRNDDGYLGLDEGAVQALKIAALEKKYRETAVSLAQLRAIVITQAALIERLQGRTAMLSRGGVQVAAGR